ncbi:cbb3-type cytochrome c oxidase subunit 3 [Kiritimatiellota bacterium B12222]|nr:cbb3-type cytochrome c oxidase subunit 3 [Kiritimatiellota bacterium B12222]
MYKDVLRAISGIGIYPIISLVIFVLFFTTVFLWMFFIRKSHAEHMAALPLHDGSAEPQELGEPHHG